MQTIRNPRVTWWSGTWSRRHSGTLTCSGAVQRRRRGAAGSARRACEWRGWRRGWRRRPGRFLPTGDSPSPRHASAPRGRLRLVCPPEAANFATDRERRRAARHEHRAAEITPTGGLARVPYRPALPACPAQIQAAESQLRGYAQKNARRLSRPAVGQKLQKPE